MAKRRRPARGAIQEAQRAVHVYLCLTSGHCSDYWTDEDIQVGLEMMADMGFPMKIDLDEARRRFVGLRKSGKLPSVLAR